MQMGGVLTTFPFPQCSRAPSTAIQFGGVHCGRAKPGRFWQSRVSMRNWHFGGESSQILAGKARKCGRFWVFACVPNPGKQSLWRQCPPSARKQSTDKMPHRPVLPMYRQAYTAIQLGGVLQGGVHFSKERRKERRNGLPEGACTHGRKGERTEPLSAILS